jgi:lysophospholipase L1-like esterase
MYRRMAATTRAAVEAGGGLFLDLSGAFDDEPGTAYAEDAVHYSALGNGRLARVLEPYVEERLR